MIVIGTGQNGIETCAASAISRLPPTTRSALRASPASPIVAARSVVSRPMCALRCGKFPCRPGIPGSIAKVKQGAFGTRDLPRPALWPRALAPRDLTSGHTHRRFSSPAR
jgi:hypothetical protein